MLKGTMLKVAGAAVAAFGTAGGFGVLASGTAGAAPIARTHTVAATGVHASAKTACPGRHCFHTQYGDAPLYLRYGGVVYLAPNTTVAISCWYRGSPTVDGDNVEDHIFWFGPNTYASGHIPDIYVNLGGRNPWQVGIPHCPKR